MQPGERHSDQDLADLGRGIIRCQPVHDPGHRRRRRAPVGSTGLVRHRGDTEFLWISRPEARHSRNLAVRPELAIVIFDSTVPAGQGQAVYVEAQASELGGPQAVQPG